MGELRVGDPAPEFTLQDENGKERKMSDYRGKQVILFFYPADDTPGCTKEVCNFRDDYSAYEGAGAELIGVSPDGSKSHTKFIDKFDLPFTLLADTEHVVGKLYGVWGPKKIFGREYVGMKRTTFLISKDGIIAEIFENVKPSVHSEQVLAALV